MGLWQYVLTGGVALLAWTGGPSLATAQDFDPETFRPSDVMKEPHSIRPPERVGDANNAATAYFKAWDMLKLRDLQALGTLVGEVEPTGKIQPQLRTMLNSRRDYVDALLAASAMDECSWGPDWEAGWEFLLPHLGYLRNTARVLRADARRCGEDGSFIAAAERVRAMLRVSVHAAKEPVLISSLVGIAIGVFSVQVTEELIDRGQVTPATARLLLKAFREVPRDDLYGMRLAVAREKETTITWLTRQCTGDHAGLEYIKIVRGMSGGDAFNLGFMSPLMVMNEQQFQRELQRAGTFYDQVIAAWNEPNAWSRLQELEEELREFQFGLVAIEMAPSVSRARFSAFDVRRRFAKIEKRLTEIAASAEAGKVEEAQEKESPKAK